ncbi:MAG: hypothetical protein Q8T08_05560, partial [Ignavibacteria bacterium]|nr:hypothetical protein [Ignavibacteria bacterium]
MNIVTLKDGAVNYDISVPDTLSENANSNEESSFVLALKEVKISDGILNYDDRSMDFVMKISDLNGTMTGDLAADQSELTTDLTAESLSMSYENLVLLSNVKAVFNAIISANLEQDIYIIKSNRLLLNDLVIEFAGTFGLNQDDIAMDFNFKAPNGEFKQLLSLIPAIYTTDFKNISTAGDFVFDGFMNGSYSENTFPGFGMNLNIRNAQFSYPDLPKKIENIEVVTVVSNETGDFDATYINLEKFNFKMAGNPFESHLKVKTPVSNPNIDLGLKGTLDFDSFASILPKEAISELKGLFVFDFALKSLLSDIENGAYQNMYANGALFISDFETSVAAFDLPIKMKKAEFNFTPAFARMQIE